jgi:hypothetical protein
MAPFIGQSLTEILDNCIIKLRCNKNVSKFGKTGRGLRVPVAGPPFISPPFISPD